MALTWPQRFFDGYARDGAVALERLRSGSSTEAQVRQMLTLLRTYNATMRSEDQTVHASDRIMLSLARTVAVHAQGGGEWGQMRHVWPYLRRIAQERAEPLIFAELTWQLAVVLDRGGNPEEALALYSELINSRQFDTLPAHARCDILNHTGTCYLWLGQYARAEPMLRDALAIARTGVAVADSPLVDAHGVRLSGQPSPLWEIEAYALNQLGNLALFQGDDSAAVEQYHACLEVFRRHNHEENLACVAYQSLGRFYLYTDEPDQAQRYLHHGLTIRRRRREQDAIAANAIYLAGAFLLEEAVDRAEPLLAEALAICKRLANTRDEALCRLYLGRARLLAGDADAAAGHWLRLLDLAASIPFHRRELASLPPWAAALPSAVSSDGLLTRIDTLIAQSFPRQPRT